jgi:hypothetical protein
MTDTGEKRQVSEPGREQAAAEETRSVAAALDEVGRGTRALIRAELVYGASEHAPKLRRTVRDAGAALLLVVVGLTAFALANWAAVSALEQVASGWRAPLLLAAGWAVVGIALALALGVRLSHLLGLRWSPDAPSEREARDAAQAQVRESIERLGDALALEVEHRIAAAVIPDAGDIIDLGEDVLEATEDVVEDLAEQLPEGGVAGQVIDLVLLPGRLGVRVVTTALRRSP